MRPAIGSCARTARFGGCHSAGRVFVGEDGEPARMRGLTWDVTDRWQSPPVG